MTTTALSDILFPSHEAPNGNKTINRLLGDLRRAHLSVANRLRSIRHDAAFVDEVAASSSGRPRPLVANERCGSWYIRPAAKGGSAYFKSTDGHTGQWAFSTRRLNLHLLPLIAEFDGVIIVDSTRRGKRMPDALSKTIPLWCCVLNRALFPDLPASHHDLFVPPAAVSASERAQMLARAVPEGVAALRRLRLDLAALRAQVAKPLRPTWVCPPEEEGFSSYDHYFSREDGDDDDSDDDGTIFADFHPVVCCTASRRVPGGEELSAGYYVQGAGDDTENWAHGLTPPVFWAHADELLDPATPEAELPGLIQRLVAAAAAQEQQPPPPPLGPSTSGGGGGDNNNNNNLPSLPPTVRRLTPYLHVSPLPIPPELQENNNNNSSSSSSWCRVSLLSTVTKPETWVQSPTRLDVGLGKHKAASRNLRVALANICDFVTHYLQQQQGPQPEQKRILVACETGGRDLAIGVALALLCWCFADDDGHVPNAVVAQPPPASAAAPAHGQEENIIPDTKNSSSTTPAPTPATTTEATRITGRENHNNKDKQDKNDEEKTAEVSSSSSSLVAPLPPPTATTTTTTTSFNKTMIKVRLSRIMTAMPDANPNRATLQSVNSFLMDWRK